MNTICQRRLIWLCLHFDDSVIEEARNEFKSATTPDERRDKRDEIDSLAWLRERQIKGLKLRVDHDRIEQLEWFFESADSSQIDWVVQARNMDWSSKNVYMPTLRLFTRAYSLNIPAKVSYGIVAAAIHKQKAERPSFLRQCHLAARHQNERAYASSARFFMFTDPSSLLERLNALLEHPPAE